MQPPRALSGFLRGLHHVAVAVPDLAAARRVWEAAFEMQALPIEFVADQKVNVLVLFGGGQRIELVEPAATDSPVTKFLAKHGSGIHHIAWRVDSVEAAIARLKSVGLRLIDERPRPGSHNTRIAFVHPTATGGVLTELVEDPGWSS